MLKKNVRKAPKTKAAMGSEVTDEELANAETAIFEQLKTSLETVNAFLLIMEVLEILVDALAFTD